MPEWMTPELLPVWCVASLASFSRMTRRARGARSPNARAVARPTMPRSEEHTSELQSQSNLVCRLLLEKKKTQLRNAHSHNTVTVNRQHNTPYQTWIRR